MATIKELNASESQLASGLKIIAVIAAVAVVTAAGERMATNDAAIHVPAPAAPAASATDYFPARFPAPGGEVEMHVQSF